MQLTTLFPTLLLTTTTTLASSTKPSPAETLCKTKSSTTGSGAFDAIHQFCLTLDGSAADNDRAHNGVTAGGFQGVSSTAKVSQPGKGCEASVVVQKDCKESFYGVCAGGDRFGHGTKDVGCELFEIV